MSTQPRYLLKLFMPLVMSLLLVGVAQAVPIYHGMDPTATFLRTDSGDTSAGPVFIYLSAYGISPGTGIYLQTLGDVCLSSGEGCIQYAMPLIAAFTTDTSLADRSMLDRLTAVGPPVGITSVVTGTTWNENLTTDILQDFAVPVGSWLYLEVPAGASFLAVGLADSFYADNSDPDLNLGIVFDQAAQIPEPGTLILLASGLGLVLLGSRRKRSS